ncbi:SURF1 family protein [Dyella caseinilytica]|uniref:SURF1-like protein n=1 Tax=Dyella caseinilytica TaxID=1849581 RepID=A0ABX7GUH9_9GAMM|nr:SURF1 family protein [Dyella caseinilytica]QRN54066.1 SURF1 family protein [Dyella caseinilytica]GFZ91322.1 SURF1-like protein [Dyella caseinilytica]
MSLMRRPAWWSVLLVVAGVLIFVRLGIWQLHRADDKEELLRRYAAAASASPQDFAVVTTSPPEDVYPRVRVEGHYLADRLYLLDNPKHDEMGGVEVYVPFQPEHAGRLLLVDLGFLPGNGTGKAPQLPPLPTTQLALQGIYQPPPEHGFEMGGNALAQQTQWPKTSIYLDMNQMAADLHATLYPRVLVLDADPAAIYVRVHTLDLSSMPPARHRAYAFQWFAFAVAAVVMFVVLHRKRRRRDK